MNYNSHMHLVPHQQSIALKELGFNEPCSMYYIATGECGYTSLSKEGNEYPSNSDLFDAWVSAPSFIQAFSFFRKKGYETKVEKESEDLYFGFYWTGAAWITVGSGSHKEAEIACLDYLIKVSYRSEFLKLKTNETVKIK